MKRLKHKILIPIIASVSTIALVAPLATNITSKAIVNNNTNSVLNNGLTSIPYTTVTYNTDFDRELGEWTVTLQGPNKVKAKENVPFGSVQRPKVVHSLNWKFLGWSKVRGSSKTDDLVKDSDPIPKASVSKLNLYPVFETPALLSNCLCISAVEATDIAINFSNDRPGPATNDDIPINMEYSLDYGTTWTKIVHTAGSEWKLPQTLEQGSTIYLKGDNPNGLSFGTSTNQYTHITFTKPTGSTVDAKVNIFGNAMGLVNNGARANQKNKCVPCDYCFYHLFENQEAIEYVSDNFLPCEQYSKDEAATLKKGCYEGLFMNCSNMIHCPRLFATNAAVKGKTGNDTTDCYKNIFNGCSKIDFVRTRYTGDYDSTKFDGWVTGISNSGTFVYNGAYKANFLSHFPAGGSWNSKLAPRDNQDSPEVIRDVTIDTPSFGNTCLADHEYQLSATVKRGSETDVFDKVYWISSNDQVASIDHSTGILRGKPVSQTTSVTIQCFSAANLNANNSITLNIDPIAKGNTTSITAVTKTKLSISLSGAAPGGKIPNFRYSNDAGETWSNVILDQEIEIPANSTFYFKGNNPDGLSSGAADSYVQFKTTEGEFKLGGSIKGLIDDGLNKADMPDTKYCFHNLFSGTGVTEVEDTYLSYTTLKESCYDSMFANCTKLKYIPKLTGTLATSCYENMFRGCTSLTKLKTKKSTETEAQAVDFTLPATTLAEWCYSCMFYECFNLTESLELKAKTAAKGCYYMMFHRCNALQKIKKVSLQSLAEYCCLQIFALASWNNQIDIATSGSDDKFIIKIPTGTAPNESITRFFGAAYINKHGNDVQPGQSYYYVNK